MKNLYLSLILLSISQLLIGQSFLRSYPVGFDSQVLHLAALSDGTIAACVQSSESNLRVINTAGEIVGEPELPPLASDFSLSRRFVTDLKATENGGFIAVGGEFECDVFIHGFIAEYNAAGALVWYRYTFDYLPDENTSEILRAQINGNLLYAYAAGKVYTVDRVTGEALEITDINNTFLSFSVISDSEIYAYSDNLGWKILTYPTGEITTGELPAFADFRSIEVINFAEQLYALSGNEGDFAIYEGFEQFAYFPEADGPRGTSVFHTSEGNFGIHRHFGDQSAVYLFDETQQIQDPKIFTPQTDTRLQAATAVGQQIFVGGHEKYVPSGSFSEKQRIALLAGQNLVDDIDVPTLDLGISALTVDEPVATNYISTSFPPVTGHLYNFENIAISVTNHSSQTVDLFAVNARFSGSNFDFCTPDHVYRETIEDADLAAGQTTIIDIPDLVVSALTDTLNFQLCFWVTHPDNQPDLIGENDELCIDFTKEIISSTEYFPVENKLQISPNPATDFLFIENAAALKNYNIFAADGRELASGILENSGQMDITDLPAGIYFLRAEGESGIFSGRFVKEQ